ncbi:MAG: hypothetical protein M0Q91_05255 [Methanoregula sp.]|jgi:hypothetical protein|nr:hypothetical protein [Methanoregula sp.]
MPDQNAILIQQQILAAQQANAAYMAAKQSGVPIPQGMDPATYLEYGPSVVQAQQYAAANSLNGINPAVLTTMPLSQIAAQYGPGVASRVSQYFIDNPSARFQEGLDAYWGQHGSIIGSSGRLTPVDQRDFQPYNTPATEQMIQQRAQAQNAIGPNAAMNLPAPFKSTLPTPSQNPAGSNPVINKYVYRTDPLATILEGALFLGDTLSFGLWKPGSALLTEKGQNAVGREYGAFSEWNRGVGSGIQRLLGQNPATEAQFTAYEQTPAFRNAGPIMQFGEGAYKIIATNPASLVSSALQGIEMYAGMGLLGKGFAALAPEIVPAAQAIQEAGGVFGKAPQMVPPSGILQTVGYYGVKTLSSPLFVYGTAALFIGAGVGEATGWGTLPASQAASNLGGMSTHLTAMGWGAMAPEGIARGFAGEGSIINPAQILREANPISLEWGVPLRAGAEGEFNYVTTLGTRNPFTTDIPTVRAYAISGVDVTGTKYGWGPPTTAMKDLTITADPLFNVRDMTGAHVMSEPQRLLLDPFFRDVSRGTVEEALVNAMFDIKANIGADIRGGSEIRLRYTNAQPAGTLTQKGINPSVQFNVHEILADAGAIRLGSAAQADWLGPRFMRDTSGSDIDVDIPKINYQSTIEELKIAYSLNPEPIRMPQSGGKFSLAKNPASETIISPGTTEKFMDVRSLMTSTASGKEIGQQTPEYGIESKASRSFGGRILKYNPETGIEVKIHEAKFDKDISDIYAASRGIARTAYEQNRFKLGQTYETISDNIRTYAESRGMDSVIRSIPEDILGTPEARAAKAIAGIKAGVYKPQIFGVDIPNIIEPEYPAVSYTEIRSQTNENYLISISVGSLLTNLTNKPLYPPAEKFNISSPTRYPPATVNISNTYPESGRIADLINPPGTLPTPSKYPTNERLYPQETPGLIFDYPPASPPDYPLSTLINYPQGTPPATPYYPPSPPLVTTDYPPAHPPLIPPDYPPSITEYTPKTPPGSPTRYPPEFPPPILTTPPPQIRIDESKIDWQISKRRKHPARFLELFSFEMGTDTPIPKRFGLGGVNAKALGRQSARFLELFSLEEGTTSAIPKRFGKGGVNTRAQKGNPEARFIPGYRGYAGKILAPEDIAPQGLFDITGKGKTRGRRKTVWENMIA